MGVGRREVRTAVDYTLSDAIIISVYGIERQR